MSMGVYISDMEMPTTCGKCRIKNVIECDRWKLVRSVVLDRHRDCPLVPVPEPHGRLIDADVLREVVKKNAEPSDAWVFSLIRTAPTIIPASKEG